VGRTDITVVTWNVEWRRPESPDGKILRERLFEARPDLVCLTEADVDFLDGCGGHVVTGGTDWGGPVFETRREVVLWSPNPWRDLDQKGSDALPQGRFARAVTETAIGALTVVGVVIPYHFSNVRSGRRDRVMWQEHELYLDALQPILADLPDSNIVLGDFNQRLPSRWVPARLREKLQTSFAGLDIVTAGRLDPIGQQAIDHIACGPALSGGTPRSLSNLLATGKAISDHFGVAATVRARTAVP
jgi:endonuclease/exonuclease/phosphatase family metal-dependent hydrolase